MIYKQPNDNLITSYCCGRDDCAIAEVEIQSNSPKDTSGEIAPSCTIKRSYSATPTIQDGKQIAITRPQTCEAPPACTHSITQSSMVSTALAHFQSYSWTTEEGVDVSPANPFTTTTTTTKTGIMGERC